jgi:hypothetical protein
MEKGAFLIYDLRFTIYALQGDQAVLGIQHENETALKTERQDSDCPQKTQIAGSAARQDCGRQRRA